MSASDFATRTARFDAWLVLTGQATTASETVTLPLLSGSMAPAIPPGAELEIRVGADRSVRTGDVVVFRDGDRLVAHRVLLALRAGPWNVVLEKGDGNRRGRWRRGERICGRVVGFARPDGTAAPDPGDPRLASEGLRCHLRHFWRRPDPIGSAEETP